MSGVAMSVSNKPTVIDLFCGAGGFSKGFENAGFNILAGIDNNANLTETYSKNIEAEFICRDITHKVDFYTKPDVIIAGPPCQGFSDARGNRVPKTREDIHRNNLFLIYLKWLKELKPKVTIFENVYGFSTHENNYMKKLFLGLESLGYKIDYDFLSSDMFGVPQKRRRFFCLGVLDYKEELDFFDILKKKNKNNTPFCIKDCLCGLPSELDGNNNKTLRYKNPDSEYITLINQKKTINECYNHIAKKPRKKYQKIVQLIPNGMGFRSDRFGPTSFTIWELALKYKLIYNKELLSDQEIYVLYEIAKKRLDRSIKTRKGRYQEGYVPLEHISNVDIVKTLIAKGYLKYNSNENAVDLTVKAGHRRHFRRLSLNSLSPTILTQSFYPRELIHPIENRGLSLREGARIQSFPDDFIFYGSFTHVAKQIGNAVPPLLAKKIGEKIIEEFVS
ncbi:MAG: DNA (cytosine-5-)-methyltransferase [Candidatus Heimdallarchaeota archaeon]|nr:DNA (cytosine-5-)-methyltransferase [Candidatus Heimdallarchaeota archaeon]